jgi:hypothetical protein
MVLSKHLHRLRKDQRGTVSVMMGFLIIPLVGALGVGFEVSNWYMNGRAMQNAADAAVLAAATNGGANYDVEARAVAAQYGFVDGVNSISIAASNAAPCPAGGNNCYSVAISGAVPLLVSQVVGYQGDTTLNGAAAKQLNAVAVSRPTVNSQLCMIALAKSGAAQGIRTNGSPTGNLNGCDIMSNTGAQCNGSNLGAGHGIAHGTSNGCGDVQDSGVDPLKDPYASLASNIPALSSSPCPTNSPPYPQETTHGNTVNPPTTLVPGAFTLNPNPSTGVPVTSLNLNAGNNFMCGDQVLTADAVINTPGGPAVLVIENGQLDLNGHTLRTSDGSAVTVVFSGDNSGSYTHAPTDNTNGSGGRLDLTAPTSGPWSGVAIYQDPSLTSGLDVSAAGNSPTWDITGLVYMPHASVTLKGAIDKGTAGNKCVVLVADNFTISGTGGILKTAIGGCKEAGLTIPNVTLRRVGLVQ